MAATKKTAKAVKATKAKAAVKKPAPASAKKKLIGDLVKLAEMLDEVSLQHLLRQALVLQHNLTVDEINRNTKAKLASVEKRPGADKGSMGIEEAKDGSYFILILDKVRNFFALPEMRNLVKVCHSCANETEAGPRLYAWLKKERLDVIKNVGISGPGDPELKILYNTIVSRYAVKG